MHAWSMNGEMRRWILLRPLKWYSIGVVNVDGKVSMEATVQLATSMHGEMRCRGFSSCKTTFVTLYAAVHGVLDFCLSLKFR